MVSIIFAATLASAEIPGPTARVGFTHGSDIIARCTDTTPQNGSFCFGFITAVFESMRAYEQWLNIREICMPDDTTLADMRDAVVARITHNPNDRLGQGASVVVLALKDKWPCAASPGASALPAPPAVAPTPSRNGDAAIRPRR